MTAKQLTDSILQMAIQGKLVPQDPNDEPAAALLERIREEKRRLVKEGKLKKKDLEETPINEDEVPFKIPESWEWCRVKDISESFIGLTYKPSDISNHGWIVLRSSNIQNGLLAYDDVVTVSVDVPEKLRVRENDIIICARNGSKKLVGKSAIVRSVDSPTTFGAFMAICRTSFYEYMAKYLLSPFFFMQLRKDSDTTTINQLTQKNFNSYLVPLPPLAEQHRIVEKIEVLLPVIKEYGEAYEEASKMDAELPDKLKKSILQDAIMGKLDTQDPNDEPASVLLEHIREEKKRLVKEGKLKKKDLIETPIEEDEQPFKIPESWEWCKIFNCIDVLYGYPFDSQKFNEEKNGAPLIRIRDIIPSSTNTYTTEVVEEKYIIKSGDMLVGMDGNFNVRFWEGRNAYLNQRVCKITAKNKILSQRYLFYYLPFALNKIFEDVSYTTVKHLSDKHLRRMNIPLPPLAEQHRIVEKIEALFAEIDNMTINDINTNEEETKETETE